MTLTMETSLVFIIICKGLYFISMFRDFTTIKHKAIDVWEESNYLSYTYGSAGKTTIYSSPFIYLSNLETR